MAEERNNPQLQYLKSRLPIILTKFHVEWGGKWTQLIILAWETEDSWSNSNGGKTLAE